MTFKLCDSCRHTLSIELFQYNNKINSRCKPCRDKRNSKYVGTKKSFLNDFPLLQEEWDYEKNSTLNLHPEKLSLGSNKKVWWVCTKFLCHKWEAVISNRTGRNSRCPYCCNRNICECGCNSLYVLYPELRQEWDYKRNGSMKTYAPHSGKKVWWICSKFQCHNWKVSIESRTGKIKTGCPYCSIPIKKICPCSCNSLYISNPELRKEWDEKKNGNMKLFSQSSHKKVWWICTKYPCHKWESTIKHRTSKNNKTKCPFCCNQKICPCGCNSLHESNPELIQEWNEKKMEV